MGRKIILSDEQMATLSACAGRGLTLDDIAAIIGVSSSTLDRRMKDTPEVKAAYEHGRAIAKKIVVDSLFTQIKEGKVAATIFYLKTQCGWREKEEETANHAEVKIYLPEKDEL